MVKTFKEIIRSLHASILKVIELPLFAVNGKTALWWANHMRYYDIAVLLEEEKYHKWVAL